MPEVVWGELPKLMNSKDWMKIMTYWRELGLYAGF
jgi:tRNA nucleotidyltransferase/poly(A) polymerase